MAAKQTNPLSWNVPIVDKNGQPTDEFMRKWNQQQAANSSIPQLSTLAEVSAILDLIAATKGDLLIRGTKYWGALPTPGDATQYLDGTGAFSIPPGTSHGLPAGGTDGQVLTKIDGTDYNADWEDVPAGVVGANPTATASDTAVNGAATTFMRSDAAPAVQKGSAAAFGILKVDGTTITATAGVISAVGGGGSSAAYAPLVTGDLPGPALVADSDGQTIAVPL